MRLYIIRHADPDYSIDSITPEGHLEAKALSERFSTHGLDRIYCSPKGRAISTMKYTSDILKLGYNIEEWTKEVEDLWFDKTPWGPLALWDMPGEVIRGEQTLPTHENWDQQSFINTTTVNERFNKLKLDSDAFLKRHGYERVGGRYRCVEPNSEKIGVFCHGGFGVFWLAHLLEIPLSLMWAGFWLPPSSVTTLVFEERSKEWAVPRCIGLGDISHLYKAGLEAKPRGIVANYF